MYCALQPTRDHMTDNPQRQMHGRVPESGIDLGSGAWIAGSDLRWSFSRSSGPGGQNVNKLNTKAELRLSVVDIQGLDGSALDRLRAAAACRLTMADELIITCDSQRSQRRNRAEALRRLVSLVQVVALPPRVRRRRRPTRSMIQRRLERKKRLSQRKERRRWRPDH